MSLLKLLVRFGGHWAGLDYIDGEEEPVEVTADKEIFLSLLEHVHHIIDVDINEWTYILAALVVVERYGIRKKKIRKDHDVLNLFLEDPFLVIFVTLRKNRLHSNLLPQQNLSNAGASSSHFYPAESQNPNLDDAAPSHDPNFDIHVSQPTGQNIPYSETHYDWGFDGRNNVDDDICEEPENRVNDDICGEAAGGEDADEENRLSRAHYDEFRVWWENRSTESQVCEIPVNNVQSRARLIPRLNPQFTSTEVNSTQGSDRWIIHGAPTFIDDDNQVREDISISRGCTIRVGAIFDTKEELSIAVGLYHVDKVGEYQTKYSDKKRLKVICKSNDCPFTISATGLHSVWRVYEVIDHTCMLDLSRSGPRRLPSKVLGAYFAPRLLEENSRLNPKSMISELQQRNSVHATYDTVLRAKHHAIAQIYGNEKQSFSTLPSYLHMLKLMNPGSITALDIDFPDNTFRNAFYALGASIYGFQFHGRPVIVVDDTHLKGKYNDILFVVVTQDGNRRVFPLAVGIGHIEDDCSWTWFLEQLRSAYGSPPDLVIVSDAHKSIANAIKTVFSDAFHCLCYYHIQQNMKGTGSVVGSLFYDAAYSFCESDYVHALAQLRNVNEEIFQKLMRRGPEKWARSQCPRRRYEFMTSNAAESFNNRAIWARTLPITSVLEVLRCVLERWFFERRKDAHDREHELTEAVTSDLGQSIQTGASMIVEYIHSTLFKVRDGKKIFTVDLTAQTCTCCQFDQLMIPCSHAAAAVRKINHNIYAYVDDYYKITSLRGMWSGLVMPIPDPTSWIVPSEIREVICLPPDRQRQAGRPRQSRYSAGSSSRTKQVCSRCGSSGHNSISCNEYFSTGFTDAIEESQIVERRRAPKKCSICRSTDHTRRKCPNNVVVGNSEID